MYKASSWRRKQQVILKVFFLETTRTKTGGNSTVVGVFIWHNILKQDRERTPTNIERVKWKANAT